MISENQKSSTTFIPGNATFQNKLYFRYEKLMFSIYSILGKLTNSNDNYSLEFVLY